MRKLRIVLMVLLILGIVATAVGCGDSNKKDFLLQLWQDGEVTIKNITNETHTYYLIFPYQPTIYYNDYGIEFVIENVEPGEMRTLPSNASTLINKYHSGEGNLPGIDEDYYSYYCQTEKEYVPHSPTQLEIIRSIIRKHFKIELQCWEYLSSKENWEMWEVGENEWCVSRQCLGGSDPIMIYFETEWYYNGQYIIEKPYWYSQDEFLDSVHKYIETGKSDFPLSSDIVNIGSE